MRRHTRAVILLGGWLLLLPPTVKDKDRPFGWRAVTDAPLIKWDQPAAYDTVAKCEAEKESALNLRSYDWLQARKLRILRQEEAPDKPVDTEQQDVIGRMVVGFENARCVPTEAVYPPQPPGQK